MNVQLKWSALCETQPHEYLLRFVFGGLVTVVAGILAKRYGPTFGGLFLAFPAIFPASITLVAKHEKEKKQKIGDDGSARGCSAAALDASGTALGCCALGVFGAVVWLGLRHFSSIWVLIAASLCWLGCALGLWAALRRA